MILGEHVIANRVRRTDIARLTRQHLRDQILSVEPALPYSTIAVDRSHHGSSEMVDPVCHLDVLICSCLRYRVGRRGVEESTLRDRSVAGLPAIDFRSGSGYQSGVR